MNHIEDIRDLFISNIRKFRKKTGQPCLTVASHGDMINTHFQLQNLVLIDERVRKEAGIIREAYDSAHWDKLTFEIAGHSKGDVFTEESIAAILRGEPVIELITHPRQWNSPIWVNLKEEISRILRGLWMKL